MASKKSCVAPPTSSVPSAIMRLMRDLKSVQNSKIPGLTATPRSDDIFTWDVILPGPPESPYEGGLFKLLLTFPHNFPTMPPQIRFVSQMMHPNIFTTGFICIDILKTRWDPSYDVTTLLLSVQALLGDPNPDSPADPEAALIFKTSPNEFLRRARIVVKKSLEEKK